MLLNHLDAQPVTCDNAGGKNYESMKILHLCSSFT